MQRSCMAVLSTLLYRAGADFVAVHSFFHTLSAANSTTEFAKILMVAATTVSSCAGVHTVGLLGHLIRMIGGRSGDSASSTMISSAPLTGRGLVGLRSWVGLAFPRSGFQARREVLL